MINKQRLPDDRIAKLDAFAWHLTRRSALLLTMGVAFTQIAITARCTCMFEFDLVHWAVCSRTTANALTGPLVVVSPLERDSDADLDRDWDFQGYCIDKLTSLSKSSPKGVSCHHLTTQNFSLTLAYVHFYFRPWVASLYTFILLYHPHSEAHQTLELTSCGDS